MTNISAQHLAIALQLCRSKPKEISIREYILHLRKFITLSTFNASNDIQGIHGIDQAGYWKSMYQRSIEEQEDLRNKIAELESDTEHRVSNAQAFKRTASSEALAVPLAKKACTNEASIPANASDGLFYDTCEFSSGPRATLLRHIFAVRRLQSCDPGDADLLASNLTKAFAALSSLLTNFLKERDKAGQEIFTVATRSILILFHALTKLSTTTDVLSEYLQNKLIHTIVLLFRQILTSVATSLGSPAPSTPTDMANDLATLGKAFLKALSLNSHTPEYFCSDTEPRSANETHDTIAASILEGVLYLLLSRAGKLIYTLTFSAPRKPTISEEISSAAHVDQLAVQKAELEGRYIAPLLSYALSLYNRGAVLSSTTAPQLDGEQAETIQREQGQKEHATTQKNGSGTNLAESQLRRLQNTLIQGVFATTEEIFTATLRLPYEVQQAEHVFSADERGDKAEDERFWFVNRVWEVCGWNVLSLTFAPLPDLPDLPMHA